MTDSFFETPLALPLRVLTHPLREFRTLASAGKAQENTIYGWFVLSVVIPLLRAPDWAPVGGNFFENTAANDVMMFLGRPQVAWAFSLIGFALFIGLIGLIGRVICKHTLRKPLVLSLLSMGSAGVAMQLFLYGVSAIAPHAATWLLWAAIIWAACLSVLAIRTAYATSTARAVAVFMLAALPAVAIIGCFGFAPYLLFAV